MNDIICILLVLSFLILSLGYMELCTKLAGTK